MSGLEVIGLVLGVWPIVMNAVDAYKAIKGGRGADLLRIEFVTEEVIFRRFVHELLSSDVSDADLTQLSDRNRPNQGLWRDGQLLSKLAKRLGPDKSKIVVTTLTEMDKLLTSLREKLASNTIDTHKGSRGKIIASVREYRNSRPSSIFRQELESLREHSKQLERLFPDCRSHGYSSQGKQSNSPTMLRPDVLRKNVAHANELFYAICDSYRCECLSAHEANLGLRPDSPKLLDASEPFELIFHVKEISEDMSEPDPKWPSSPSIISTDPTEDCDTSNFPRRWSCSRNNSISPSPPRAKRGRSVSFGDSQSSQIDVENVGSIDDLCTFVRDLDDKTTSSAQNSCLGVLGAREKKYTVRITSMDGDSSTTHSVLCLDDCLVASQSWELSRRTRMGLALSLSLAILQFYSTPWIDMWWTWKDFGMLKGETSQIFITRKFYSTQSPLNAFSRQASHSASISEFWDMYGEPVLTRLGFALVELALGKRLSQLRPPSEDRKEDEDQLDLLTAKNIVKSGRVLDEAGQAYNDAVQACLEHQVMMDSGVMGLNSRHQNFQQDLEKFVVGPIRNYHAASWPQVASWG